jgi:hypothetical protein
MRVPVFIAIALAGLLVAGGLGAGGYFVGRNAEPSQAELAAERAKGRRAALDNAESAARRARARVRRAAVVVGEQKGRTAGEAAGRQAGEAEVAQQDLGPTPLPAPKLMMDIGGGYGDPEERPAEIFWTNHTGVQNISWSSWGGDVAEGSGTLLEVTECKPSCAEDPGKKSSVTVKAWEPMFNPDSVRIYSKFTVIRGNGEKETHDVAYTGAGSG